MKLINLTNKVTNWLHWLDMKICLDRCNTNIYFTTLFFYISILMGYLANGPFEAGVAAADDAMVLDTIFTSIPKQIMGLGTIIEIIVFIESVTLCVSFESVFMRFVIVTALYFGAYLYGVLCPQVALWTLIAVAVCYIFSALMWIVKFTREAKTA